MRVVHVEGRLLLGIAVRPEAVGVELIREPAAGAGPVRLDLHLVLARARRRTVRQQVEPPRRRLDARANLVEPLLDVGGVLRGEGARAADARQLAAIDLLPGADHVGVEAGAVEGVVDVLGAGAVGAVGAVGEHHQRAEAQRHGRALHLLGQEAHPFDDGAVQVGRRIARALHRQRRDAPADVPAERDDLGEVGAAVEAVDGDLLIGPDPLAERGGRLDEGRHVPRVDHAAAHVDDQQGVMNRGDLRLEDGLLALQDRDWLLIFVDFEILRRQIGDGLAIVRVDRKVDGDVGRFPHRGVHHLQLQPTTRGESGGEPTRNHETPSLDRTHPPRIPRNEKRN